MGRMTDGTQVPPPRVGDAAPTLVLPTLAGEMADLADARGQPALVSFLRHAG
jgi:peroxiredoxin